MINSLPQDVNEYMYEFLFFSSDHNKYYCISHIITKTIHKSQVIKHFNIFKERINMIKEDGNDFIDHLRHDNNMFKLWIKYHLYNWNNITNYSHMWKLGDYVDVLDFVNGWCPAIIIGAYIQKRKILTCIEYTIKYNVKFLGWDDKFVETVDLNKIKNLGTYTPNPLNMYDSISRDCSGASFWALCKHDKQWTMSRITENNVKDDCVNLLSSDGMNYTVTRKNIHNVVRHITDATSFFSIQSVYDFFKKRTFKF
jgi:hypothetical protein